MKIYYRVSLLFVLMLLIISTVGVLAAQVNPGVASLSAWWALDEISGTRADSTGVNTLTESGMVGYAGGKLGNAASFSGSEYLYRADNGSLSMGDIQFSICGWIYVGSKAKNFSMVSKWAETTNLEYSLYYDYLNDKFYFSVTNNGSTVYSVAENSSPALNTWYFLCGWHDSVANYLYIQKNLGTIYSNAYSLGVFNGVAQTRLGARDTVNGIGRLDEVAVFKQLLSPDNREYLYNGGTGRQYCEVAGNCATPTPTITNTSPPTNTFTPTATDTPLPTLTDTPLPTVTDTPLPTLTDTPLPTVTDTSLPTSTNTSEPTATETSLPTATETSLPTATDTPVPVATNTLEPSLPPDGFLSVDWVNYAVSMGLLLLGYPLYALVWILLILFIIPEQYIGLSAFVVFMFIIYRKFMRGAS